jgi:hypothetical protein
MAEWSEILWEGWLVEHHPHVRDCENIANELYQCDEEVEDLLKDPVCEAKVAVDFIRDSEEGEARGDTRQDPRGQSDSFQFAEEFHRRVRPGGILDLAIRAIIDAETVIPQPVFRVSGALSILAMAVGSRVETRCGMMPKLFMVNLANTGEGKDAVRKVVSTLDSATSPYREPVGSEDEAEDNGSMPAKRVINMPHSDSALLAVLRKNLTRMIFTDEFGTWFINARKSSGTNEARLLRELTKLFTHGREDYTAAGYANPDDEARGSDLPGSPFVGMYALAQDSVLIQNFNATDLQSGLIGRFLVFSGDNWNNTDVKNDKFRINQHPELICLFRQWREWDAGGCDTDAIDALGAECYLAFNWNEDVAVWRRDTVAQMTLRKREGLHEGDSSALVYTRFVEHTLKIALLLAIDELPGPTGLSPTNRPIITLRHIETAQLVAHRCTEDFRRILRQHIFESPHHRLVMRVLDFVRKTLSERGPKGFVRQSEITKRFQGCARGEREAALKDLEAYGIREAEVNTAGRTGKIYFVRKGD